MRNSSDWKHMEPDDDCYEDDEVKCEDYYEEDDYDDYFDKKLEWMGQG